MGLYRQMSVITSYTFSVNCLPLSQFFFMVMGISICRLLSLVCSVFSFIFALAQSSILKSKTQFTVNISSPNFVFKSSYPGAKWSLLTLGSCGLLCWQLTVQVHLSISTFSVLFLYLLAKGEPHPYFDASLQNVYSGQNHILVCPIVDLP